MSADGADTTRTSARSAPTDGEDVKVVLEQTLLTCPEVFVYRIPPMMTSGGHRAEDWNLAKPLETCSLVVMRRDDACLLRLLSEKPKKDGPPGATEPHLFCECQIQLDFGDPTKKLEHWVEAVVDSSRYSVIRISDERTGREAHVGVGFRERSDAVDFKMSFQEYENALRRERKAEAMYERSHPDGGGEGSDGGRGSDDVAGGSGAPPGGDSLTPPSSTGGSSTLPAVGKLTLKEGEKIHVNLKGVTDKDKDTGSSGSSGGLRKSTALGLSGRKAPPAGTGALVGKGGLLLKKPPSDRQVVAASPPTQEGETTKPAAGASATSTTSSSGTNTPKSSDEPPPPTSSTCTPTAEAGGGGGSEEGNGNSDSGEDDFGDFEEAGN